MRALTELRVSLVQTDLVWHDPAANLKQLASTLAPLAEETDLIVLPEMFTSGFTTHPETVADGHIATRWLIDQAARLKAAITGSIACQVEAAADQPAFVNRLLFVTPEGEVMHYDKVHLFRMADEHKRYQAGGQRTIINYCGWRLLLTVCYDLRFPVFCRNQNDYDGMVCVANWPAVRRHHWRSLLQARAIENQAYVFGVNRVGIDGNDLSYSGDSLAIDFSGETLIDQEGEWLKTVTASQSRLQQYRDRFPAWKDADTFSLSLQ